MRSACSRLFGPSAADFPSARGCLRARKQRRLHRGAAGLADATDSKIAAALLGAVTTAALPSPARRTQSALASLLSTVHGLDTPLEVDTKIANALLGLATEAFVAAQLASRDVSILALQGGKADASLLASYATNAALSARGASPRVASVTATLSAAGAGWARPPTW